MPQKQGVFIEGLDDFRKELRSVDGKWNRELGAASFEVASFVVADAEQAAQGLGGVAAYAAAHGGLKPSRAATAARITLGGPQAPMELGAEFGSIQYHQFKPWLGADEEAGYVLFPTIRRDRDRIGDTYLDLLEKVARAAFPH